MDLNDRQIKLLAWVEEKRPVLGLFHNMENIKPMIDEGLVESRPVPRMRGQLLITPAGRAILEASHAM